MRDLLARPSLVPRRLVLDVAVRLDDLEGSARFAELLARARGTCEVRALGDRMLAQVGMARGQIARAGDRLDRASPCDPAAATELRAVMAAQPFVHLDVGELMRIRRQLDTLSSSALSPELRSYYAALIDLRLGDTAAVAGVARALQSDADSTDAGDLSRTLAQSLRARLHLARQHPAWALADLESAGWEKVADRTVAEAADRFLRAELLREQGRLDEAIDWYGSIAERASYELVYLAPAELGIAKSYEAKGDSAAAIAHYRRFVELWRRADSRLQPAVAEAEGRIRGLERR
jgi:tetratricopeptide (TPR) repeat protein